MLQDIRKNVQGTAAKIVVGLIVISFAFFGIESILVGGGGNEIAEVNGDPIFPQQLQQALNTQKRRLISMMGDNFDPTLLDDDVLGPQALEALINRQLLMQAADEMGLVISDTEIGALVGNMEQFQVDGVFSPEIYKSVLSSAGYTPAFFKQSLAEDMLMGQLRSGIAGSEFVTAAELELNTQVIAEQRDLRYFSIQRENYSNLSQITDAQIEAYYNEHQDYFRTPESVDLDYLELTLDDFREPVDENAVLEAYELAKMDLQFQSQNRVSHILFETDADGDIDQRIAQAQERLSNGESFAEVAQALSDDVGSSDRGGDLGYTSGDTFPEPMEEAIAQLEPGVVSAPVETDAGIHLILVTERKDGETASLEDMQDELRESIQAEEARIALLRTVESLRDLSFNAEDLAYPAKELGLTVEKANAVTRTINEGIFSNSVLLEAAFSEDVLEAGNNSEVIEFADNRFVVMSVRNHNQPQVKPLAGIRDEVIAVVAEETARAAVVAQASQALKQLRAGVSLEQLAEAQGYDLQLELGADRRNTAVPPEALRRVFELPSPAADELSADFVMMPNGDVVVVELLKVNTGDYTSLPAIEQAQLQQILSQEFGGLIDAEYQNGLRARADITIL
ncbi:Peptidyl-prolyl cis-trans isomerase D [Halioglobus japonicus]|nr:Peptidyl-prolyl cis-trans isomerase D [Halioglobus japonicus]